MEELRKAVNVRTNKNGFSSCCSHRATITDKRIKKKLTASEVKNFNDSFGGIFGTITTGNYAEWIGDKKQTLVIYPE